MDQIISKVRGLVDTYKTNCPFKLARYLGIQIVQEDLGNILGYYNRGFRIKMIHINENAEDHQKKFVCSHELGHAIFHPDANTPFLKKHTLFSTDRIEREANFFAINLLFSKDYIRDQVSLEDAVNLYGIPEKLIMPYLAHKNF